MPPIQLPFKLSDINFKARKSQLTMIIGKPGSGKSSLLKALLGEMQVLSQNDIQTSSLKYSLSGEANQLKEID